MPLEESTSSERPQPIHELVKRYNYQHLHECRAGTVKVEARGKTYTGGEVAFNQCAPFGREQVAAEVDRWDREELSVVIFPEIAAYLAALSFAFIAAAASSGDVIDQATITMKILD